MTHCHGEEDEGEEEGEDGLGPLSPHCHKVCNKIKNKKKKLIK
jgi:hypothetical protein